MNAKVRKDNVTSNPNRDTALSTDDHFARANAHDVRATILLSSSSEQRKDTARGRVSNLAEIIKVTAWPFLALAFFVTFHEPIRRTIRLIPDKLEKADKANVGTLSWEIQRHAQAQGGADLAERVGRLSSVAIRELMNTPRNGSRYGTMFASRHASTSRALE
jgi:hypothetical protein